MIEKEIAKLAYLCSIAPSLLNEIDEYEFSLKPILDKWSKKEIIGHLIDSATNNHQRFIRCQFENTPEISYDQDKWNTFSYHQNVSRAELIDFWKNYNLYIVILLGKFLFII